MQAKTSFAGGGISPRESCGIRKAARASGLAQDGAPSRLPCFPPFFTDSPPPILRIRFARPLHACPTADPPRHGDVCAVLSASNAFSAERSAFVYGKSAQKKSAAGLRRIFGNKAVLRATSFPFHRRIRPAAGSCSSSGSSCRSSSGYTTTTRPTKPCSSQRR